METQPILRTSRLMLRPFTLEDSPIVQELVGDRRLSEMTVNIPYLYVDGMAESWISSHAAAFSAGKDIVYAVTISDTAQLIDAMSLA